MSRMQRYLQMFDSPLLNKLNEGRQDNIQNEISTAMKFLKKDDRVVWYLRLYKEDMLQRHFNSVRFSGRTNSPNYQQIDDKKERAFISKMKSSGGSIADCDYSLSELKVKLKHISEIDIHSINNMKFGWRSPSDILSEAEDHELTWVASKENITLVEYGTKIMDLPDDFAWFDLERGGCPLEGGAMAHCGNNWGNGNQTILSLRKFLGQNEEGENQWRPFLTFILDKSNGFLGEMKGRANSKPAARYHDAIYKLLAEHDPIKKVVGGGYLAENNFSLSDFSAEKFDNLMMKKPLLFSINELYRRYGDVEKIGDIDFADLVDKELGQKGIIEIGEKGTPDYKKYYALEMGMSLSDISSDLDLSDLGHYEEVIEEGYFDIDGSDWNIYDDEIASALSEFKSKNPEKYSKMVSVLTMDREEELEDFDRDLSDPANLVSFVSEYDTEFSDSFNYAVSDAESNGAYYELTESIDILMKNLYKTGPLLAIRDDNADEYYTFNIVFTKESYFKFADEYKEQIEHEVSYKGISESEALYELYKEQLFETADLHVPYNGFSGFCNDTFKERLSDHISEELSNHPGIEIAPVHEIKPEPLIHAFRPFSSGCPDEHRKRILSSIGVSELAM